MPSAHLCADWTTRRFITTPYHLAKQVLALFPLLFLIVASAHADQLEKQPNHIYIATFNVYKLGSVDPKYTGHEEEVEGPVGAFDLIAFQEVTDGIPGKAAIGDLVNDLRNRHGLNYDWFLSDYIGQGLMREAIAFVYNPAVVKPELLPGLTSLTENIEIDGRDLVRTQWEANDFDFTLISAHLAWGNEGDRDDGYREIDMIFHTPTPSIYSDDPDIIVLGDFNRFGAGYDSVEELRYDPDAWLAPTITFFDPGFSSLKQVSKSSIAGKGVPHDNPQLLSTTVAQNRSAYDMILISNDVAEEFPAGSIEATYGEDFGIIQFDERDGFGYQPLAGDLSHNDLKEAYSDHRPLWMAFRTDSGAADDGVGGVDLTPPVEVGGLVGTEFGKMFHRPDCWTITGRDLTKHWQRRAAAASELLPCGVCKP